MTREQVRRELSREIGANAASAVTEVLGLRALAAKHAREHASVVQILEAKEVELVFTVRENCAGASVRALSLSHTLSLTAARLPITPPHPTTAASRGGAAQCRPGEDPQVLCSRDGGPEAGQCHAQDTAGQEHGCPGHCWRERQWRWPGLARQWGCWGRAGIWAAGGSSCTGCHCLWRSHCRSSCRRRALPCRLCCSCSCSCSWQRTGGCIPHSAIPAAAA